MGRFHQRTLPLVLLAVVLLWALGIRTWYASKDLNDRRFWDEAYNVANLHAALETDSGRPADYAYLRLTYLPQAAVLWTLEQAIELVDAEFSWFEGTALKPAGFLVCRLFQTLLGAGSVLLTYLVGVRLFSPPVGVLAAFLLAGSWLHVVFSGMFKPEILLLTTLLAAFIWSLDAIERPTLSRYLLAGLGIGLALSSKQTGGPIAIPLTLASLYLGWKDRRHWRGLALAGLTSLAVFVALNPYAGYFEAFRRQRAFYRAEALRLGTRGDPFELARHIFSGATWGTHGRWVGMAVVAGLLLLAFRLWKRRREGRAVVGPAMLLIFILAYPLVYGTVAGVALAQNILPLAPFTALVAAVFLLAAWHEAAKRLPGLGDRWVAPVAATALVAMVAHPLHVWAYKTLVPTTTDVALATLASELPRSSERPVRWEGPPPELSTEGPPKPIPRLRPIASDRLTDLTPAVLELADAEVFPLVRAASPEGELYRQRMETVGPRRTRTIESAPFRAWGPSLVLLLHPWQAGAVETLELESEAGYRFATREDLVEVRFDGIERLVLRDNNRCADLILPVGAEVRVGYGLVKQRLRKFELHKYVARFGVRVRPEGAAEASEIFQVVFHFRTPDGGEVEPARRSARIPLDRHAGQVVQLCVSTERVGAPASEPTEGFAFWDEVAILDGSGREHTDLFRRGLRASGPGRGAGWSEAAALAFVLPGVKGVAEAPHVRAGRSSIAVRQTPHTAGTLWSTDRFPLNRAGETPLRIRLPPSVAMDRLPVTVSRWQTTHQP